MDVPADEVDRVVAAWALQRPDLDLAPLTVLSRIGRIARRLDLARRSSFADHGLEQWEFDVLAALRRAGPPFELSPSELLRETLVSSGTMTNRVDRLAERGTVARRPDPHDRRGVLVRLTDEGRVRVDAAFETLLASERALLAGLTGHRRAELAALLRDLTLRVGDPSSTGAVPGAVRGSDPTSPAVVAGRGGAPGSTAGGRGRTRK